MARILIAPSYGGLLPDAANSIIAKVMGQDENADYRSDSRIIAGIEEYAENWFDKAIHTEKYLKEHADTLVLMQEEYAGNGIVCRTYIGYSKKHHGCKKVGICEYDEKSLRVMVTEYDGAELLAPVPRYKCKDPRLNLWEEKWQLI